MSALRRRTMFRPSTLSRYALKAGRPSQQWLVPAPVTVQRAAYAVPPHDKKDDDLGGPYGQEAPTSEQRKRTNSPLIRQAALVVGLGLGFVAIFSVFASPRKIAQHQIDNDTVIGGGLKSNTGGSLAAVKRKEGIKTTHELHAEQTGSSPNIMGTR